ncbi:MAG TPA: hypothetical protein VFI86_08490, partial [Burkholderiales bacterium]|nr:hypothetical protein [Burkholderiales bacterium]
MLLQCGIEDDAGGESARLSWLRPETLESLTELNELSLTLLAEQAAAPGSSAGPVLREVRSLWPGLDAAGRRRAAGCPYLLLDAGFADPERWRGPAGQVGEGTRPAGAPFFTVPGTVEVLQLALTYAWHLARTQIAAARLLLGAPASCATLIGGCTLPQIHGLAERHAQWLRPRWAARPQMWRGLLLAAGSGEPRQLEEAHMHGLTLLAAETRALAARAPLTGAAAVPMAGRPAASGSR